MTDEMQKLQNEFEEFVSSELSALKNCLRADIKQVVLPGIEEYGRNLVQTHRDTLVRHEQQVKKEAELFNSGGFPADVASLAAESLTKQLQTVLKGYRDTFLSFIGRAKREQERYVY